MFVNPDGFQVHEVLPAVSEAEKAAEVLRIARLCLANRHAYEKHVGDQLEFGD